MPKSLAVSSLGEQERRRVWTAFVVANLILIPIAIWLVVAVLPRSYGVLPETVILHAVLCFLVAMLTRLAGLIAEWREAVKVGRLFLAFTQAMALWPLAVCVIMIVLKLAGIA